jgi:hypothetical protein
MNSHAKVFDVMQQGLVLSTTTTNPVTATLTRLTIFFHEERRTLIWIQGTASRVPNLGNCTATPLAQHGYDRILSAITKSGIEQGLNDGSTSWPWCIKM